MKKMYLASNRWAPITSKFHILPILLDFQREGRIAIMTDKDDPGESAIAYYGDITFKK